MLSAVNVGLTPKPTMDHSKPVTLGRSIGRKPVPVAGA
jgi:hypothetical protein